MTREEEVERRIGIVEDALRAEARHGSEKMDSLHELATQASAAAEGNAGKLTRLGRVVLAVGGLLFLPAVTSLLWIGGLDARVDDNEQTLDELQGAREDIAEIKGEMRMIRQMLARNHEHWEAQP